MSSEYVRYRPASRCDEWSFYLYSRRGQLELCYLYEEFHTSIRSTNALKDPGLHWEWVLNQIEADQEGFDFRTWGGNLENSRFKNVFVGAPHWALVVPLAASNAALWLAGRRRRNRLARNLCVNCGYDLRATPERCPECGNIRTG